MLKIDDELNGRGIAYAELGASKAVKALLRKSNFFLMQLTIRSKMALSQHKFITNLKTKKLL